MSSYKDLAEYIKSVTPELSNEDDRLVAEYAVESFPDQFRKDEFEWNEPVAYPASGKLTTPTIYRSKDVSIPSETVEEPYSPIAEQQIKPLTPEELKTASLPTSPRADVAAIQEEQWRPQATVAGLSQRAIGAGKRLVGTEMQKVAPISVSPEKTAMKASKLKREAEVAGEAAELVDPTWFRSEKIQQKIAEIKGKDPNIGNSLSMGDISGASDILVFNAFLGGNDAAKAQALQVAKEVREVAGERQAKKKKGIIGTVENVINSTAETLPMLGKSAAYSAIPIIGPAVTASMWVQQGAGEVITDLKEEGVDDDTALAYGLLGALPYAAVEQLQIGQILNTGVKKAVSGSIKKKLVALAKEKGLDIFKEMAEEGAQAGILESVTIDALREAGHDISNDEANKRIVNSFIQDFKGSAGQMTLLSLLGFGAGAARVRGDVKQVTPTTAAEKTTQKLELKPAERITVDEYNQMTPEDKDKNFYRLSELDQDRLTEKYEEGSEEDGVPTEEEPVKPFGEIKTSGEGAQKDVIEPFSEEKVSEIVQAIDKAKTSQERSEIIESLTDNEARSVLRRRAALSETNTGGKQNDEAKTEVAEPYSMNTTYTEVSGKIGRRREEVKRNIKKEQKVSVESGISSYENALIKEYGETRPTKKEVSEKFNISREEAGTRINAVYGKSTEAERNLSKNNVETIVPRKTEDVDRRGLEIQKLLPGVKYRGIQEGAKAGGRVVPPTMLFDDEVTGSTISIRPNQTEADLQKKMRDTRFMDNEAKINAVAGQIEGLKQSGRKVVKLENGVTQLNKIYTTPEGKRITIKPTDTVEMIQSQLKPKDTENVPEMRKQAEAEVSKEIADDTRKILEKKIPEEYRPSVTKPPKPVYKYDNGVQKKESEVAVNQNARNENLDIKFSKKEGEAIYDNKGTSTEATEQRGRSFSTEMAERPEGAGRNVREAEEKTRQGKEITRRVYNSYGKKAGDVAVKVVDGNDEQRIVARVASKITDTPVVLIKTDGKQLAKDNITDFAGVRIDGTIYLNVAEGQQRPLLWIVGHEWYHGLSQSDKDYIMGVVKLTDEGIAERLDNIEEFEADIVGEIFGQKETLRRLASKNPVKFKRIIQKLIDAITDTINKFNKIFSKEKNAQYEKYVTNAEEIRDRLVDVLASRRMGKDMADGVAMAMAGRETADTFYSPLLKAVQNLKQQKGTGEQFFNMLTKTPGVKEAEWKWMGLDDFLRGKQSVTRQEIEDFVQGNQVQVEEVGKKDEDVSGYEFKSDGWSQYWNGEAHTKDEWRSLLRDDSTFKEEYDNFVDESDPEDGVMDFNDYLEQTISDDLKYSDKKVEKTKYSEYQLPGGENYREVLLTLPKTKQADTGDFKSSHWDEPNVIAHIRMNDREVNGEKVLFIEEIQSDWAREAREKGTVEDRKRVEPLIREETRRLEEKFPYLESVRGDSREGGRIRRERYMEWLGRIPDDEKAKLQELRSELSNTPNQPFLKNWEELTLKRILRLAAEEGYDRVAWINGEQTAARYDLSKQIREIRACKKDETYGTYHISADDTNGKSVIDEKVLESALPEYVGNGLAKKIIDNNGGTYSGIDLKIGGEWAIALYDKMIPKFYEKYGKKWNVKVEPINLDSGDKDNEVSILELSDGTYAVEHGGDRKEFDTEEEADAYKKSIQQNIVEQQSIPITDDMRSSVLYEGQPMFAKTDQAKTEAFKKWFGDWENDPENASKVVDKDGKPLVVYHGSGQNFNIFETKKEYRTGSSKGYGFYFTDNKSIAKGYQKKGGKLFEVYLSIKKPLDVNAKPFSRKQLTRLVRSVVSTEIEEYPEVKTYKDGFLSNIVDTYSTSLSAAINEAVDMLPNNDDAIAQISVIANILGSEQTTFKAVTKALGYDGVYVKDFQNGEGDVYLAWYPTQIKSATENVGTLAPENPDIRFAKRKEEPATTTNTVFYQIGDVSEKKKQLRKKLGKIKEEDLDQRILIEAEIDKLDDLNRERIASNIIGYAQRIGLRGEPYNRVDVLVKNVKTANGFRRAVEVMDNVMEKRNHRRYQKLAEKFVSDAYKYLKGLEGKKRPITDLESNRTLKEYLDAVTSGDEETRLKARMMSTYYTQYGDEEIKKDRDIYVKELGTDIIKWIEEGTEEIPEAAKVLLTSLSSNGLSGMSNRQLLQVVSDIKSIRRTGRTAKKMKDDAERKRLEAAAEKISLSIIANTKEPKLIRKAVGSVQEKEKKRRFGWIKDAPHIVYTALDTERILERISGTLADTVLKKEVYDPAYRAVSAEKKGLKIALEKFQERYKGLEADVVMHEPLIEVEFEYTDSTGETVKEIDAITINEGMYFYAMSMNDAQREALIWSIVRPATVKDFDGNEELFKAGKDDFNDAKRKIAEATIDQVVAALPEQYKEYVRKQWKYNDEEQHERISKEFAKTHGVDMPKEKYYFPINRNPEFVSNIVQFDLLERMGLRQAKVDGKFTITRVPSKAPLKNFDYMGTVVGNMLQTEHYIAFNEPINKIRTVLNQQSVRQAIKDFNPEAWNKIDDWVKALAYGRVDYGGRDDAISKGIKKIRKNAAVFQLGFKASSIMIQTSSYFRGMSKVQFKHVIKVWGELAKAIHDGRGHEFFKEIDDLSPIMVAREQDSEQILQEWFESGIADKILKTEKGSEKLKSIAMKPMAAYDKFLASMIWKAKFNEVIEKGGFESSEDAIDKAVYEADKVVRRTQSGSGILASTGMQRGAEWQRMFTQYASDSIKGFNMLVEFFDNFKEMAAKEKAALIGYGFVLPAIVANFIRSGFRPPWDEPEEVAVEAVKSFSDGLPIVGMLLNVIATAGTDKIKELRGKPPYTYYEYITDVNAPVMEVFSTAGVAIKEAIVDNKFDKTIETVGTVLGVPGGAQVTRLIKEGTVVLEGGKKRRLIIGRRADREFDLVGRWFGKNAASYKDPDKAQKYIKWAEKTYRSWDDKNRAKYIKYIILKKREEPTKTIDRLFQEQANRIDVLRETGDKEGTERLKKETKELREEYLPKAKKYREEAVLKPYPKEFDEIYNMLNSNKNIDKAKAKLKISKLNDGDRLLWSKYKKENDTE